MKEAREGGTILLVPDVERPEEGAVFYNPVQRLARDFSVCVYSALGASELCDPLCASGARGVRLAKEVGMRVTCADRSEGACELARRNSEANGVDAEIVRSDANALMAVRAWEAVDLDPFGSPVPFLEMALRASKRYLAITATDPAALCGVYPRATRRKYLAFVTKTEFYHEVGIRILAGYAIRMAARFDIGLEPLICHSSNHYYRIYFRLARGAGRADAALGKIGSLLWCPECLERGEAVSCGHAASEIGPLFTGKLFDGRLAEAALGEAARRGFSDAAELLGMIAGEADLPPWHYDHHSICSLEKIQPGKLQKFLEALKAADHSASRTHFSETGFRTDAPLQETRELI